MPPQAIATSGSGSVIKFMVSTPDAHDIELISFNLAFVLQVTPSDITPTEYL
jgi:hypothetical protein